MFRAMVLSAVMFLGGNQQEVPLQPLPPTFPSKHPVVDISPWYRQFTKAVQSNPTEEATLLITAKHNPGFIGIADVDKSGDVGYFIPPSNSCWEDDMFNANLRALKNRR
jgi:hypothetical protein